MKQFHQEAFIELNKGSTTLSILRRAGKNIFYKAVAEILSRLIYLFFFIYMARHLGTSDFGLFSFAFSFAGIFVLLVDPGLNILLTRDVSRDRTLASKYSNNIFTIKIILSFITLFLLWNALRLFGYDKRTIIVVMVMGIFLILNCFFDFFVALSNAYERMDIDAAIKVTNKLLISVLGLTALLAGSGIVSLMSFMVFASVIAVFMSYYYIKKGIINIKLELDWRALRSMHYTALPMALTSIFALIYFKVDVVMLSMFGISNADIGVYSAAIRLIEVLNVIPAIFVGGLFPILAGFSDNRKAHLESAFRKSFQFLLLIVFLIFAITVASSQEIIRIIYGSAYSNSAQALSILIWTSLFIFPNVLFINLIVIANKQMLNALFAFSCLLLNIILNLFLIPRYGFIGASIATVATDMMFFALTAAFAVKYFSSSRVLIDGLKPLLCGALLTIILLAIKNTGLIIIVPTALIVYVLLILLTKTLSIRDLKQLKEAFVRP
jgi:O-antigen/teichoic acid export membrane protein